MKTIERYLEFIQQKHESIFPMDNLHTGKLPVLRKREEEETTNRQKKWTKYNE